MDKAQKDLLSDLATKINVLKAHEYENEGLIAARKIQMEIWNARIEAEKKLAAQKAEAAQ